MDYDRKIILCRMSDADRQRYIDKCKSLSIDKCPREDCFFYFGAVCETELASVIR